MIKNDPAIAKLVETSKDADMFHDNYMAIGRKLKEEYDFDAGEVSLHEMQDFENFKNYKNPINY